MVQSACVCDSGLYNREYLFTEWKIVSIWLPVATQSPISPICIYAWRFPGLMCLADSWCKHCSSTTRYWTTFVFVSYGAFGNIFRCFKYSLSDLSFNTVLGLRQMNFLCTLYVAWCRNRYVHPVSQHTVVLQTKIFKQYYCISTNVRITDKIFQTPLLCRTCHSRWLHI
jgi:hypothetical protein